MHLPQSWYAWHPCSRLGVCTDCSHVPSPLGLKQTLEWEHLVGLLVHSPAARWASDISHSALMALADTAFAPSLEVKWPQCPATWNCNPARKGERLWQGLQGLWEWRSRRICLEFFFFFFFCYFSKQNRLRLLWLLEDFIFALKNTVQDLLRKPFSLLISLLHFTNKTSKEWQVRHWINHEILK